MADDPNTQPVVNPDVPERPEYMLTTVDNPYDPWTQFDEWFAWDMTAGYNTPGMLARMTYTSDEISEADQALAIQDAINLIVQENYLGVFKKVRRNEMKVA